MKRLLYILFFPFILLPDLLVAQNQYMYSIYVLEDKEHKLTIEDVITPQYAVKFDSTIQGINTEIINHKSVYWLRFKIKNPYQQKLVLEGSYLFQEMQFFARSADGTYKVKTSGLDYPFEQREIKYKNIVFDIPMGNDPDAYYFLRLKSNLNVGFGFPVIPYQYLWNYSLEKYLYYGLILGIVLLFGIYNLIMFIQLKENVYLYYSIYVFAFALFALVDWGLLKMIYWQEGWQWSKDFWTVPFCVMTVSLLLYSNDFLENRLSEPYLYRFIVLLAITRIVILVFGSIFKIELFYEAYIDLSILVAAYWVSIYRLMCGYKLARFFVCGFSILFLGYLYHSLKINRWLPDYPIFQFHNFVILEIIVFSIALADRYRAIKKEGEASKNMIIEQLREKELIKDKINKELEEKVKERTMEIERMNNLLEEKNKKLEHDVIDLSTARIMQKEVSFDEFKQIYPDEDACLKYLSEMKWAKGFSCRKCRYNKFSSGSLPFSRRCRNCRYTETVKANTLFNNLKFPLVKAFYMVFLLSSGKDITADEFSDILDLRRQTCWMFKKKVLAVIQERKYFKKHHDGWSHLIMQPENLNLQKE